MVVSSAAVTLTLITLLPSLRATWWPAVLLSASESAASLPSRNSMVASGASAAVAVNVTVDTEFSTDTA